MPASPTAKLDLIATSTFGLEAVVARELQWLGYEAKIIQPGRVLFAGDESDICRTNLWLRSADRILLRLDTFQALDFGQLFDRTRALAWEAWLPVEAEFPVSGRSVKSQLSSVPACQKIVKKAIVERLKAAYGVEWFVETGPKFSVEVALLDNWAMLTIDTSGAGLHKRGYRPLTGKAPLKETLAAALILLSVWRPERPLVDPFCGSGTIPIEAALIGRNMAPGLGRPFAAEAWPRLPASLWEAARQQAREAARPDLPDPGYRVPRIIGTDVDEGVLGLARFHAEKAGVAADIHFQQRVVRRAFQQTVVRLRDLQSALWRAAGPIDGGTGLAPCHAQRLSPFENVVVLYSHRAAGLRGGRRPIGHAAAETVQRADRMHVLPVSGTEAGREQGAGSRE